MKVPSLALAVVFAVSGLPALSSTYALAPQGNASEAPPSATVRCEANGTRGVLVHEVVSDLVLVTLDDTIHGLNIEDCSVRWSWKGNASTGDLPAYFDDTLYVVDEEYPDAWQFELVAIEAMTGTEKWRVSVDARIGVNLHDGVLLVQGVSEIVGMDPGSGAILWRKRPTIYENFSPYPFQGGRLFVSDVETSPTGFVVKISALDVRTGELAWSLEFNDAFVPSITTGPEQVAIFTLLFVGGTNSPDVSQTQIGVDVLTGNQLWGRNIDLNLDIHFLEQKAYATHGMEPDAGMSIVALDVSTGQTGWTSEIPDSGIRFLTRHDDLLLVGIQDATQNSAPSPPWRLIAYDIASESMVWTRVLQHNFSPDLEWETTDGAVVFAEGNTLNAVDIETGDVVWTYSDATVTPTAKIAVGKDIVVIGDFFEGRVLFLEPPKLDR